MIEIDLLPLELRKKKKIPWEQFFKTKFIIGVLGCLVLFHLLFNMVAAINAIRLSKLKNSWQSLSSKREEIDQLKNELKKIEQKIPLIEQLISKRVLWSKTLDKISDSIVNGIWLNEITIEKKKAKTESLECLIIRGSAASRIKDEPALIGRFMQNLKDDPFFSADFTEIELGPITKRQIAQTEIMDFVLICQFKSEKAQTLHK